MNWRRLLKKLPPWLQDVIVRFLPSDGGMR